MSNQSQPKYTREQILDASPSQINEWIDDHVMSHIDKWLPPADWSGDISAAWEVYQKIRGKDYWIGIETFGNKHRCLIISRKYDITEEYVSESVPEAICKAALLAVMDL